LFCTLQCEQDSFLLRGDICPMYVMSESMCVCVCVCVCMYVCVYVFMCVYVYAVMYLLKRTRNSWREVLSLESYFRCRCACILYRP